jgi:putative FmdB family regulatory protein
MPRYEYRCPTCDTTFELRRSMAEANDPASCPDGHPDAVRLLSVFASVGTSSGGGSPMPAGPPPGGCGMGMGTGCGCAH